MKIYGQLESVQAENLGSNPTPTPWGRFFFDTALKLLKYWNGTSWAALPGRLVVGSRGTPQDITSAGIILTAGGSDQVWFVQGSGGAVTVTANPAISAGSFVGQRVMLKGRDDTKTLRLNNGNGLSINGDCLLDADATIAFTWDGTNWSEDSRR